MSELTVNVRKIGNAPKFEYLQLPYLSRSKARKAVLSHEAEGLKRRFQWAREDAKKNINKVVNSTHHIRALLWATKWIVNISNPANVYHLENVIIDNLCNFLEDGTYILYVETAMVQTRTNQ
jgi:hypothetical protein